MNWIFPYLLFAAMTIICLAKLGLGGRSKWGRRALLAGVLLGGCMTVLSLAEIAGNLGLVDHLMEAFGGSGGLVALCIAAAVGGYVRFLFVMSGRGPRGKPSKARGLLDNELM
jgi:hypothetical protein